MAASKFGEVVGEVGLLGMLCLDTGRPPFFGLWPARRRTEPKQGGTSRIEVDVSIDPLHPRDSYESLVWAR